MTLLYVLVVWVSLIAVPREELAQTAAPLSLVYERVTGASPALITAIAIAATINGIIVFMVMGSRVIYGMAAQGLLPAPLARVNPRTRTPLTATGIVVAAVLGLALAFPIEGLAEASSRLTLIIFAFVNAALLKLKIDGVTAPAGDVRRPRLDTGARPGYKLGPIGERDCSALLRRTSGGLARSELAENRAAHVVLGAGDSGRRSRARCTYRQSARKLRAYQLSLLIL